MGTAYCLQYMHHDLNPPVAHSNLNSGAIYLTDDYAAKVNFLLTFSLPSLNFDHCVMHSHSLLCFLRLQKSVSGQMLQPSQIPQVKIKRIQNYHHLLIQKQMSTVLEYCY